MPDFNNEAENYTADPEVEKYGEIALGSLKDAFPGCFCRSSDGVAMDFGTGGGSMAFRLLSTGFTRVVALDPAENMIAALKRRIEGEGVQGIVPFQGTISEYAECSASGDWPTEFDLITCSSVLSFVEDKLDVMKQLAQHLRSESGRIVHWDWKGDPSADEAWGLTVEQIKHLHRDSNLETLHADKAFTFMDMDVVLGIAKRNGSV